MKKYEFLIIIFCFHFSSILLGQLKILPICNIKQLDESWCWAANVQMITQYYSMDYQQCEIVKLAQNNNACCNANYQDFTPCGTGRNTTSIVNDLKELSFENPTLIKDNIIFDSLKNQIDLQQPTILLLKEGHFVLNIGYDTTNNHLIVNDPLISTVGTKTLSFVPSSLKKIVGIKEMINNISHNNAIRLCDTVSQKHEYIACDSNIIKKTLNDNELDLYLKTTNYQKTDVFYLKNSVRRIDSIDQIVDIQSEYKCGEGYIVSRLFKKNGIWHPQMILYQLDPTVIYIKLEKNGETIQLSNKKSTNLRTIRFQKIIYEDLSLEFYRFWYKDSIYYTLANKDKVIANKGSFNNFRKGQLLTKIKLYDRLKSYSKYVLQNKN